MIAGGRVMADQAGTSTREVVLTPDDAALAALAQRLGLPAIMALTGRFALSRDRAGTVIARGTLDAMVVQEDVATLDSFEAPVHDSFTLRFMPEDRLGETLDPDDPVDDVGYAGNVIDLEETLYQQLALALDPYPHKPG